LGRKPQKGGGGKKRKHGLKKRTKEWLWLLLKVAIRLSRPRENKKGAGGRGRLRDPSRKVQRGKYQKRGRHKIIFRAMPSGSEKPVQGKETSIPPKRWSHLVILGGVPNVQYGGNELVWE